MGMGKKEEGGGGKGREEGGWEKMEEWDHAYWGKEWGCWGCIILLMNW